MYTLYSTCPTDSFERRSPLLSIDGLKAIAQDRIPQPLTWEKGEDYIYGYINPGNYADKELRYLISGTDKDVADDDKTS